jgi:hypothetical protein
MAAMAVSWCARNFMDDANTIVFSFSRLRFAAGSSMVFVVNVGGLGDGDEDELHGQWGKKWLRIQQLVFSHSGNKFSVLMCFGNVVVAKLVVAHLCQEKIYPILLLLHKIQNFFICRYVHKVDFVYRVPYQPKRRMDMMNESRFMVYWFLHLPRKT